MTPTSSTLVFFVNGIKVVDNDVDPEWTLLYYLRNKLRLCGTKLGCGEGGCGACTVMISKYDRSKKTINHLAVNACLAPVCAMHGLAVTTVEGIGSTQTRLHPVQERIAKAHGSQCGFCTPGIVMSMYSLLRSLPGKPTMKELEVAFQGNLCRCTGYRPIIEGYRTFTEEWEQKQRLSMNGTCAMGKDCCRNKANGQLNGIANGLTNGTANGCNGIQGEGGNEEALFNPSTFIPYDSTQEPIFPPELMLEDKYDKEYFLINGPRVTWYRPTSFEELLHLKQNNPQAKLINGNTEVGVEVKFKNFLYPMLICPNQVPQMTSITKVSNGLKVGAAATLSEMESVLKGLIKAENEEKTKVFKAIVDMLHWFAGKQIRNVGTVGGNIMTGSPISDLNPIFMAANITLELMSEKGGRRVVVMDENFWTGYRRNIVKPEELLVSVTIPFTSENQYFIAYKQAKRRDDDIAIVNAAYNLVLEGNKVKSFKACYGGMAPTSKMALKTSASIAGREWTNELLNEVYSWLIEDFPLDPGVPGGMAQYRKALVLSFFFKFHLEVCEALGRKGMKMNIPEEYKSGRKQFHSKEPKNSQYFQVVNSTQEKTDMVGRPLIHQSAFKQATGEAIYCDDIPRFENESHLVFVVSSKPHAKILSLDPSEALAVPGVLGFFSAKDFPDKKRNMSGPIIHDDQIFANEKVICQGQVVGVLVAEDQAIAQRARKLVKIEYEDLSPVIITIEEAIKAQSYFPGSPKVIRKGDTEGAFAKAQNILEGDIHIGGQEHFYLETHAAVAIPKKEDDEIEVVASTQHPSELQHLASKMLGIPSNRITCKVKRLGGGFGGKESRSCQLALPVIFAAHRLKRPVRMMLDRDEDMMISGQRHPFYGKYKVAFTSEGKITAVEISLYNNAGCTTDLSEAIMERAMFHFENAAYIPNVTCYGYVCKTNLPSNTAFRGFGGPQGMLVGESMIRQIADHLGKDPLEINQLNFYKEGDFTHFNQQLIHCTMQRCWSECLRDAAYNQQRKDVDQFNRENRWKKRGLAVVPTKFGISFTTTFLNQAGALLLVYSDGSVLISHGGAEMGQGLHTKMIQVASRALGIPPSDIHISETATDKVPNTSATAASAGSDLNGMAVLNACNIINERLKPIKTANPKGSWKDWVSAAYFGRVSLAASGFYQTPDIDYNMETNSGNAFNYFTYGVACTQVEIDCLTGDHQVLKTDIVMDLGESLNPAIDIGQIEGAFMQGYGLFTLEEMVVSPTGTFYSRGPGAYKIPGFADIPAEFNVSLLKGAPNPRAVYSSKAVGEPPLFLASSAFFAIRDAIKAARKDVGLTGWFPLNSPATAARIRMACSDDITKKFPEPPANSYTPWNVQL